MAISGLGQLGRIGQQDSSQTPQGVEEILAMLVKLLQGNQEAGQSAGGGCGCSGGKACGCGGGCSKGCGCKACSGISRAARVAGPPRVAAGR